MIKHAICQNENLNLKKKYALKAYVWSQQQIIPLNYGHMILQTFTGAYSWLLSYECLEGLLVRRQWLVYAEKLFTAPPFSLTLTKEGVIVRLVLAGFQCRFNKPFSQNKISVLSSAQQVWLRLKQIKVKCPLCHRQRSNCQFKNPWCPKISKEVPKLNPYQVI